MEKEMRPDKESEFGQLFEEVQRFKEQYEDKQASLIRQLIAKDAENREEIVRLKQKLNT